MRKYLIAGNWKMNCSYDEAAELAEGIANGIAKSENVEALLIPPSVYLDRISHILEGSDIKTGAQNMHNELSGAYTGELSANMLLGVGCEYVLVGHSERRQYFNESDEFLNNKMHTALNNGVTPILCIGETLGDRESDNTFKVLDGQLRGGLAGIKDVLADKSIVIAYEPIWAIGTGKVATKEQAQEVHKFIRETLADIFDDKVAQQIQIQYGGSVKPDNITELIAQPDIDGALVGGASLKVDSFLKLVEACK
jgi:triosephosphate isomerase